MGSWVCITRRPTCPRAFRRTVNSGGCHAASFPRRAHSCPTIGASSGDGGRSETAAPAAPPFPRRAAAPEPPRVRVQTVGPDDFELVHFLSPASEADGAALAETHLFV